MGAREFSEPFSFAVARIEAVGTARDEPFAPQSAQNWFSGRLVKSAIMRLLRSGSSCGRKARGIQVGDVRGSTRTRPGKLRRETADEKSAHLGRHLGEPTLRLAADGKCNWRAG